MGQQHHQTREIGYAYENFHASACYFTQGSQMHMPCNAYSKSDIYFNSKSCQQDQKDLSSGFRDRINHDWREFLG
jgi:hypothetical protein